MRRLLIGKLNDAKHQSQLSCKGNTYYHLVLIMMHFYLFLFAQRTRGKESGWYQRTEKNVLLQNKTITEVGNTRLSWAKTQLKGHANWKLKSFFFFLIKTIDWICGALHGSTSYRTQKNSILTSIMQFLHRKTRRISSDRWIIISQ